MILMNTLFSLQVNIQVYVTFSSKLEVKNKPVIIPLT